MFLYPSVLLLLMLIPVLIAFLIWRGRARAASLRRIADVNLVGELSIQVSRMRRLWKSALWLVALAALIVALARPVWGIDPEIVETRGVAVMVLLDVSASMDAQDILPSRLERSKLDIRDLFEGIAGHDVGLILFAGSAFVQFPLTNDILSALTFLSGASTASITHQGTATEQALRLALELFDGRIADTSIIVLFSDGENQDGDPLLAAADAAEKGIIIHTIGYGGTEGVPIPIRDERGNPTYKADRNDQIVLTKLDETALKAVAETTGGTYQHADESRLAMGTLIRKINEIEGGQAENRLVPRQVERFGFFVALALLALSLEMLLPETRGKVP